MKYDEAWLLSDSQIIGRAQKNPHEQGVLWAINLPDGELFGAVLAKADANSVSQFCNMVRDEWNERKEESEAKARRAAASRAPVAEQPTRGDVAEGALPPAEAKESKPQSFSDNLRAQLALATDELNAVTRRQRELSREVAALTAAVRALDAPEDDNEKRGDISIKVASKQG